MHFKRRWILGVSAAVMLCGPGCARLEKNSPPVESNSAPAGFYLPENPSFTIVQSAAESLRFTLDKTLKRDEQGNAVSISSFVDPEGQVMGWHDFGNLEGPGWAANAAGGA